MIKSKILEDHKYTLPSSNLTKRNSVFTRRPCSLSPVIIFLSYHLSVTGFQNLVESQTKRKPEKNTSTGGYRSSERMGVTSDDAVLIEMGKKPGEPHIITVNCPDKAGLACDICNIILDFGLYITKGGKIKEVFFFLVFPKKREIFIVFFFCVFFVDVSTDGIWCFMVFWVVPHSRLVIRWTNLKNRLLSICPPCSMTFYYIQQPAQSSSPVYLLKFCSLDRKGLLHGNYC